MTDDLDPRAFRLPKWANVYALVSAVPFGLVLMVRPDWIMGLLGLAITPAAVLFARAYATSLFQVAIVCWVGTWRRDRRFLLGLSAANCLQDILLTSYFIYATQTGVLNGLGWQLAGSFATHVIVHGLAAASLLKRPVTPAA